MPNNNYRLETSGRPELQGMERNVQRALDGIRKRADNMSAAEIPFTADPGVFADPQPTNLQDAVMRIAAFVATTHATTIP